MLVFQSLYLAALLCVPTLGSFTTRIKQSVLKRQPVEMAKATDMTADEMWQEWNRVKVVDQIKHGMWQNVFKGPMEGLSPQCQKAVDAEVEKHDGISASNKECSHTACTGRIEAKTRSMKKGHEQHSEGPMCMPKECQNGADLKIITAHIQDTLEAVFGEKMKVTFEIDCSASGGADKGAGGDGEITVDDDYIHDAQPLYESRAQQAVTIPPASPQRSSTVSFSLARCGAIVVAVASSLFFF